ncbi:MAG: cell division protein ZapA [bacterium]
MNKVSVEIMGKSYTLVSDEEEKVTKIVAGYVDKKIKEIYKNLPSLPLDKLAILAGLEIADELFKTKRNVHERIKKLSSLIDSSLK